MQYDRVTKQVGQLIVRVYHTPPLWPCVERRQALERRAWNYYIGGVPQVSFNQQIAQYRGKIPEQQLAELAVSHFEDQLAKNQTQVCR